jgi:hypothetical protein
MKIEQKVSERFKIGSKDSLDAARQSAFDKVLGETWEKVLDFTLIREDKADDQIVVKTLVYVIDPSNISELEALMAKDENLRRLILG